MHRHPGSVLDAYIASQANAGAASARTAWPSLQDAQVCRKDCNVQRQMMCVPAVATSNDAGASAAKCRSARQRETSLWLRINRPFSLQPKRCREFWSRLQHPYTASSTAPPAGGRTVSICVDCFFFAKIALLSCSCRAGSKSYTSSEPTAFNPVAWQRDSRASTATQDPWAFAQPRQQMFGYGNDSMSAWQQQLANLQQTPTTEQPTQQQVQ